VDDVFACISRVTSAEAASAFVGIPDLEETIGKIEQPVRNWHEFCKVVAEAGLHAGAVDLFYDCHRIERRIEQM